jgi:basic membrane protein A
LGVYAGTFGDPGLGKEIADGLYAQGADYVATFAGAVNLGVFQSATAQGEGYWALGAALGQFGLNPDKIIASQVKTIDIAVYTVIKELSEGNFKAGLRSAGILEGGVDILYNPNNNLVDSIASQAVYNEISRLRDLVIKGEINIPITKDQLAAFQP